MKGIERFPFQIQLDLSKTRGVSLFGLECVKIAF